MSECTQVSHAEEFLGLYAGLDDAKRALMLWLLESLNALPEGASHAPVIEEAYRRASELRCGQVRVHAIAC